MPFTKGDPNINRKGRPEGSISIIGKIRKKFKEDPLMFDEYVDGIMKDKTLRKELIQQLDGKPKETVDLTHRIPKPILDNVFSDNSDEEDSEAEEEN